MTERDEENKIEILLVDDRAENLIALEAVLADPGYSLVKVSSGDDALRYLLSNEPALILMDVQMPGLDGYETATIIKKSERTREIPIIFVTAINKDEKYVHKGYDHGAVDYIYKPYDAHILKAKVAVFAEMRRQQEKVSRLVSVQESVTRALAESAEVKEAIPKVLRAACTSLGWDLGLFWGFDKLSGTLSCQAEWHSRTSELSDFLALCFEKNFAPGLGLPGRAWAAKKSFWIEDMAKESLPRASGALRADLHTEVCVPVSAQDEVLGVLEFFSSKTQPSDYPLLKIMGAIGSQVGQVMSRAKAFDLVRADEARKAAVLETALDCIISLDASGRIIEFNSAAENTFGRRRAEVMGKWLSNYMFSERYPGDPRNWLAERLLANESRLLGCRIEITGLRSDGRRFPAELSITRVKGVEPPQFTGFLRDISSNKKAERNAQLLTEVSATLSPLLDYEERVSATARLAVQSFASWCVLDVRAEDPNLNRLVMSHRDLGRTEELNKLCAEHPPGWGSNAAFFPSVSDSDFTGIWGNAAPLEAARTLGIASLIVVPLTARGKSMGVMAFVSADPNQPYDEGDFTFAKELASRVAMEIDNAWLYHDAQVAISTRDEFFSIASHELKTPITTIKMQLEMTRRMTKPELGVMPPAERLAKMLNTSVKQVDRLTHLVEDLLDVVRIRTGKLRFEASEVNLSELVAETVDGYADVLAAAHCEVDIKAEAEVLGIWDRDRIEQVLVNLIGNAIKYAPGKPITIEVSQLGGHARLLVRDQGPGIAPDRQSKIFERFERAVSSRSISGLGLGLFIAKRIVEAHHGTITVNSREGEGSVFEVDLPLRGQEPGRAEESPGLRVALPEPEQGKRQQETS